MDTKEATQAPTADGVDQDGELDAQGNSKKKALKDAQDGGKPKFKRAEFMR